MPIDRNKILNKYNSKCSYCGCDINLKTMQVDHLIPKVHVNLHSKEIIDSENNLMPSCRSCNSYKNGSSLEEFRNWLLGKLHERLAKQSMYKVAVRFGIIKIMPFNKKFYFENLQTEEN